MKIDGSLIETALNDISVHAGVTGYELGDGEYVTALEFAESRDALRFMTSLALRLREVDTDIGVLASVAAVETISTRRRTVVRFRGWKLED